MSLKLSILGFIAASFLLALWLFLNLYAYQSLSSYCADGKESACDGTDARWIALQVGTAVAAWSAWGLLLFRSGKTS